MPKITSPGKCRCCGELFDKSRMSTHLKSCAKRIGPTASPKPRGARSFHLVVEARYNPHYWLHLEVPATARFGDLDRVLRDVWLECCGHMSAFRFPRPRVPFRASGTVAQLLAAAAAHSFEDEMDDEQRLMGVPVGKRLQPGAKLEYEYDFGSTTELSLRVVGEWLSPLAKSRIRVLARNEPPDIRCTRCKKPATQICTECECQGDGALCETCAANHECGEKMFLPIVNSPRTGVCGYCGPSVEP
ncbi:MAG: hypothetical protein KIS67_18950 [Verrucomicrobiae bacterium]|nr:hypothetical protein [Verrucomicrobiae bacterium]